MSKTELYHHGVKGMRWGVRKETDEPAATKPSSSRKKSPTSSNVAKKTTKKKKRSTAAVPQSKPKSVVNSLIATSLSMAIYDQPPAVVNAGRVFNAHAIDMWGQMQMSDFARRYRD